MSEGQQQNPLMQVTGLWINEGKRGKYMSGSLSPKIKILIFKVTDKKNDKGPDYLMYFAQSEKKHDSDGGGYTRPPDDEGSPF
jgi:hypothetical protein